MDKSSLRPIPLQHFDVSSTAEGFQGSSLGRGGQPTCCALTETLTSFMPLPFPHWTLCPSVLGPASSAAQCGKGCSVRPCRLTDLRERGPGQPLLSRALDISSSCRALVKEFQCQPEGGGRKGVYRDMQGCTTSRETEGRWSLPKSDVPGHLSPLTLGPERLTDAVPDYGRQQNDL